MLLARLERARERILVDLEAKSHTRWSKYLCHKFERRIIELNDSKDRAIN